MHKFSYPKHVKYLSSVAVVVIASLISGAACRKEVTSGKPPEIEFLQDSGMVWKDTIIPLGARINIGLKVTQGDACVTWLGIRSCYQQIENVLDSGMYSDGFTYVYSLVKNNNPEEIWQFIVMDMNREHDTVSLIISRAATQNYGEIYNFPSVILSAQNNPEGKSFFSLINGQTFTQSEAFQNQSLIDLIYYFDVYEATLSSPNETDAPSIFNGETGLANWTVKNETRYDSTRVTSQEFDQALNDSLLLSVFVQVDGKRKAKFIQNGQVISFSNHSGKIGLIKVVSVTGNDSGTVELAIKIQK